LTFFSGPDCIIQKSPTSPSYDITSTKAENPKVSAFFKIALIEGLGSSLALLVGKWWLNKIQATNVLWYLKCLRGH